MSKPQDRGFRRSKLVTQAANAARHLTALALERLPIRQWPALCGRLHELSVPHRASRNPRPEPRGPANINILLELLDRTTEVRGAIAECGVYRGSTLVAMALHLKQKGLAKAVYGFDSFEGFGDVIQYDLGLERTEDDPGLRPGACADTSLEIVYRKLRLFGLADVKLIPGFFETSLAECPRVPFSFVHLDCDAHQSYLECLRHFYSLMAVGGIILLDEYNDPAWPGCNLAVDRFLAGKPEQLEEICHDNHIKYYFVKQSAGIEGRKPSVPASTNRSTGLILAKAAGDGG